MIDLYRFQKEASEEISDKFFEYNKDPLMKTTYTKLPFYQGLSAITGSGKTAILADTVQKIRLNMPISPIILWLSKGKVVVWQTYENLSNGKYKDLIQGYKVKKLLECSEEDIENEDGLILVATVAKFNNSDREESDRKIFEIGLDKASDSLWNLIKKRSNKNGIKRNLIIVYDEGHNLSDQQTKLLIDDLQPDALISASATNRLPSEMEKIISRLKDEKGYTEKELITNISSKEVVNSQLIKKGLEINAYNSNMEIAIDDMLKKKRELENIIKNENLDLTPKAIYVTNTNQLINSMYNDNIEVDFLERKARPIVIWNHLVKSGVDPDDIAVYCDLKFDKKFPPPEKFNLYSKGDKDYYTFTSKNYKHIIFNLSLQEGWDDPECYFAYIDKEMGSKIQISQVAGRVLRQPRVKHYKNNELNLAYFYIRSDEQKVLLEVLDEIKNNLTKDIPEIEININTQSGNSDKVKQSIRKNKTLPEISIDCTESKKRIKNIVDRIPDYRDDKVNTIGNGSKLKMIRYIGENGDEQDEGIKWVDVSNANKVSVRWIFKNEIQKYYNKLINLCDIEDNKFNAMVEYNSIAADQIRECAYKVIDEYINYSQIVVNNLNLIEVKDIMENKKGLVDFKNSIHPQYSNLNGFEKKFALSIDKTNLTWLRNSNRGMFEIPLLDKEDTNHFNPDFIIWKDKDTILAIDTKGDHILAKDKNRKLFSLINDDEGIKVKIILVSEGKWKDENDKYDKQGYTIWSIKNSKLVPYTFDDIDETVKYCINNL